MSLNTYDKNTKQVVPVDGIYEVDSELSSTSTNPVQNNVIKSALDAKADTDTVNAIQTAIANKALYFTGQACSALTGNFCTISNVAITADHVVAECTFANPSAITSDVTWTTANGSLTLNGTCSTATTVNIVLVKKDN